MTTRVVLIVEGLNDEKQVRDAFDGIDEIDVMVTEGTKVNTKTIDKIQSFIDKGFTPYILSDPDEAGEHLAEMIQSHFPSMKRIEVDLHECGYYTGTKIKGGIEYSSHKYLKKVVAPYADLEFVLDEKRELPHQCNLIRYKINEDGCWICTSHQFDKDGYPRLVRDGKKVMMSRYVFEIYKEQIYDNNVMLHSCDNPNCINPDHLSQGTHQDNIDDRDKKKRHGYGAKNGNAKLSEEQAIEIKEKIRDKSMTYREIANEYGVSKVLIQKIASGKLWKHID